VSAAPLRAKRFQPAWAEKRNDNAAINNAADNEKHSQLGNIAQVLPAGK
jgi:hypothetical protein